MAAGPVRERTWDERQRAWLRQFLGALVVVSAVFGAAHLGLALLTGDLRLWGSFAIIGLLAIAAFAARDLVGQQRLCLAAQVVGYAMLGHALAQCLLFSGGIVPFEQTVFLAVAVVLPYLDRSALRRFLVVAFAVGIGMLLAALYLPQVDPAIPPWLADALLIAGTGAVLYLASLVLWQFNQRLRETLAAEAAARHAAESAAEKAESARHEAEQASRVKDEFLAMLGHELRNPLSPIVAAVGLMRERNPALFVTERDLIERQAWHMVHLVDDLLDVSRVAQGKLELHLTSVELGAVVRRALEVVAPLMSKRMHNISVDLAPTPIVQGDEQRLVQVVVNLLDNAAKYTPPGGTITVTTSAADGECVLRVRDTGSGIAPELLPRMFDIFVQGRRSLDRGEGGLGLGLAIVRSLVQLHGGSVEAHSAGPGRGSELVVRLPVHHEIAGSRTPTPVPSPLDSRRRGTRILVVDDNQDVAQPLAALLEERGFLTRVAFEAGRALEEARDFAPEVALLDIGLPGVDGYELGERLRKLPGLEHLVLIAISGYGTAGDVERTRRAGFLRHFVKPVDHELLVRTISAALEREAAAAT